MQYQATCSINLHAVPTHSAYLHVPQHVADNGVGEDGLNLRVGHCSRLPLLQLSLAHLAAVELRRGGAGRGGGGGGGVWGLLCHILPHDAKQRIKIRQWGRDGVWGECEWKHWLDELISSYLGSLWLFVRMACRLLPSPCCPILQPPNQLQPTRSPWHTQAPGLLYRGSITAVP